jgi:hypothetical protein
MKRTIARVGYYSAIIACIATAGYSISQLMQIAGWLKYPADAVLIFGFSLLIPIPFLLAILALHYSMPHEKKIWTHAALLSTVMYATYVILNYVVQLATVLPMKLQEQAGEVSMLDQTPHSLFWDIDALGYIFLGIACLFASLVFENAGRTKWVKWFLLANAAITPIIGLIYFYPRFSIPLLLIGSPWIISATGSMLLLGLYFRSELIPITKAPSNYIK